MSEVKNILCRTNGRLGITEEKTNELEDRIDTMLNETRGEKRINGPSFSGLWRNFKQSNVCNYHPERVGEDTEKVFEGIIGERFSKFCKNYKATDARN